MRIAPFSILSVLTLGLCSGVWLPSLSAAPASAGGDSVSVYSIGPDGNLTAIAGSPFTAGSKPDSVAVDPKGRFVYAVNGGGSNNVSAFSIAPGGGLTPVPGSPFPAENLPSSVVVDPTARFVYVVNESGGNISGYAIGSDGTLTPITG